jgi:6-phosphogluconolactonase/glucosamine-6-phosphate isomerase/deaminase
MAWSTYSIVNLDERVVDSNDVDQTVAEAVQINLLE